MFGVVIKVINLFIYINRFNEFNLSGASLGQPFRRPSLRPSHRAVTKGYKIISITIYLALVQIASNLPTPYLNPIVSKISRILFYN